MAAIEAAKFLAAGFIVVVVPYLAEATETNPKDRMCLKNFDGGERADHAILNFVLALRKERPLGEREFTAYADEGRNRQHDHDRPGGASEPCPATQDNTENQSQTQPRASSVGVINSDEG